jgi:CHAT domain-containing protein
LWGLFGAKLDATLRTHGVKRDSRIVWLPSGWLGILPFGLAQDPASGRRFADDYEIVYAPSLEALAASDDIVAEQRHLTLAAAINPTGDLPGTEREGALVASHFAPADRSVLEGTAATPDAVLSALKGKSHWHFASHGTFAWLEPRNSALVMHGGALTVGRLLETTGLGRPRLVVLSACETGLSDVRNSPDEFIGLPGTFTALGAAGVLGTLWPVSDAATALLMAKFYDLHLGAGVDPPTALRRAQAWLRRASDDDLDSYAKVASAAGRLQGSQLAAIAQEVRAPHPPVETGSSAVARRPSERSPTAPYAHPYYWGGFIYTGQ